MSVSVERIRALLAAQKAARAISSPPVPETIPVPNPINLPGTNVTDRYGNTITLNSKQQEFANLAASGESCILLGAAGTGKTTCCQAGLVSLIQSGKVSPLKTNGHKYLKDNTPGIVICAYTRRAVANIARNMPEDLKDNCITIHKLLEYEPVYSEVEDPETGKIRRTMSFEPARCAVNPLPTSIHTILIEESSMVSVELFKEITDALTHPVQFIFVGDIQQLPPVFGSAILGFKMLELPTVELTQVYRQALESPIIRLAHRILSGEPIPPQELPDWKIPNKLTLHPWKKKLHPDDAIKTAGAFLKQAENHGLYDPDEDIILCPFNKSFGTIELNKIIANHLARKLSRVTYEITAGFNKHYLSPGDRVLYEKEDAKVISIAINGAYVGAAPQMESTTLDYWGHDPNAGSLIIDSDAAIKDVDSFLESVSLPSSADEDRTHEASHIVTIELSATGATFELSKASQINNLSLGYALTVHKSQGSEWRKVYIMLHASHATMLQRELLYTAVTRAKEELYVICEPNTFVNGILSQRIKGNTLAEKAEFFKGKLDSGAYTLE